jgi:cytidylate kinase
MEHNMIITVSKQTGCGEEVCEALAQRLSFRVINKEMVGYAATLGGMNPQEAAQFDEGRYSFINSLMANFVDFKLFRAAKEDKSHKIYNPYEYSAGATADNFTASVNRVFHTLAQEGKAIIVGRGGNFILKDHPKALHIRFVAPIEMRVANIAESMKLSKQKALKYAEDTDENKEKYVRNYCKGNINDPTAYHLTINLGRYSTEKAAELVTQVL